MARNGKKLDRNNSDWLGMHHAKSCDIFLDLTQMSPTKVPHYLKEMAVHEGIFAFDRNVTAALPFGLDASDLSSFSLHSHVDGGFALQHAIELARLSGRALAIISGEWTWRNQSLVSLMQETRHDPMIGSVQPRFASADGREILSFAPEMTQRLPIAASVYLPKTYITLEYLSPMILVTEIAVGGVPSLTSRELPQAVAELLQGLRRRGYRNLLCNHIMAPWTGVGLPNDLIMPTLFDEDSEKNRAKFAEMPEMALEAMLSEAISPEGKPKLLLDCRGLQPHINGTTIAILGFLDGFQRDAANGLPISILVSSAANKAYDLKKRFTNFDVQTDGPRGKYMAIVVLNQPWELSLLREMHHTALICGINMLDTIAWDISYVADIKLRRTWAMMAQFVDILFFNSAYSSERFAYRFNPDPRIPRVVTHHSTAASEIRHPYTEKCLIDGDFILMMGNDYPHKEMIYSLEFLASAFPYEQFVCVGASGSDASNVIEFSGKQLSGAEIASLYSNCKAVVYPSHYEGFGLPVVEALAYNKPIVVRDSSLWDEISSIVPNPEKIHRFRGENGMMQALGRIMAGEVNSAVEIAPGQTLLWEDCAGVILDAVSKALSEFDGGKWLVRNDLFSSQADLS